MPRHSAYVLSAAVLVVMTAVLTQLVLDWKTAEEKRAQAQKIAHLALESKTLRNSLARLKLVVRELQAAMPEAGRHEEQEGGAAQSQQPTGPPDSSDLPASLWAVSGRKSGVRLLAAGLNLVHPAAPKDADQQLARWRVPLSDPRSKEQSVSGAGLMRALTLIRFSGAP